MGAFEGILVIVGLLSVGLILVALLLVSGLRKEPVAPGSSERPVESPGRAAADALDTGGVSLVSAADLAALVRASILPSKRERVFKLVLGAFASAGVSLLAKQPEALGPVGAEAPTPGNG